MTCDLLTSTVFFLSSYCLASYSLGCFSRVSTYFIVFFVSCVCEKLRKLFELFQTDPRFSLKPR